MAVFPSYVVVKLDGFSQRDSLLIERTDMERGVAKVRRVQDDPMVTVSATLYFRTTEHVNQFRQWFYSASGAAAGAAWFDWTDPRTGTVRQCRFVPESMGPLTPRGRRFQKALQEVSFEYLEQFA